MLLLFAFALAVGIAFADYHPLPTVSFLLCFFPCALYRARLVDLLPLGRFMLVAAMFVFLGATQAGFFLAAADHDSAVLRHHRLPVETRCRTHYDGTLREGRPIVLRNAQCLIDGNWIRVGIRLFPAVSGDVGVSGTVLFSGRLDYPPRALNPADTDARSVARRQGVSAWLRMGAGDRVAQAGRQGSGMDRRFVAKVDELYGTDTPSLLVRAMLTGDQRRLPERVRDEFRRAGIAHVLAVSGLHTGIVIALVVLVAAWLSSVLTLPYYARSLLVAGTVLLVLALVLSVVGFRPSVWRASILASALLFRRMFDRSGGGQSHALALCAILLLLFEPAWLSDVGFQLSFTAVAALLLAPTDRGFLVSTISASFLATLFTAPIVAFHFGAVPLVGIVLNLLAIPLTTLLVTGAVLSVISSPLSHILVASSRLSASGLMALAHGSGPFSDRLTLSPFIPVLVFLLLPILLAATRGPISVRRFAGALLVSLTLLLTINLVRPASPMIVTFLATGQGDAAIISTTDGRTMLVDVGPETSWALPRELRRTGVSKVDLLVLTHAHADHIGGLDRLLGAASISRALVPEGFAPEVLTSLEDEGVLVRTVSAGDTVHLHPSLFLSVLAPPFDARTSTENERSVVLRLVHGRTSFLFTGDVEALSEKRMVTDWSDYLSTTVVKVAHHGSKTSSSPFFVRRVSPETAVISVGRNNYGLPSLSVIDRWKEEGSTVHITREQGALCLRSFGDRVETGC